MTVVVLNINLIFCNDERDILVVINLLTSCMFLHISLKNHLKNN